MESRPPARFGVAPGSRGRHTGTDGAWHDEGRHTVNAERETTAAGRHERRIGVIDMLRGLAASAVVLQHVAESSGRAELWPLLEAAPGVFGVVLFFLISGFVIPLSLRGAPRWQDFALRRLLRIYPLTLFAFALLAGLMALGLVPPGPGTDSGYVWLMNLLLLQDFVGVPGLLGVTWTLPIEFAWYGLFGLCVFTLGRRGLHLLALAFPLGLAALVVFSLLSGVRLPFGRIGMLYAAVVGMQVYRHAEGEISRRDVVGSAAVFVLLMLIANGVAFGHFTHPSIRLHHALVPWLLASLLFFLALSGAATPQGRPARALLFLGRISFSLYLLHPIVMVLVHPYAEGYGFIIAVCGLTVPLAWLSFTYVETPGIALGRALVRPRPAPAAGA